MRFGPCALTGAEGAVLAHSLSLGGGAKLRKGRVLTQADLAALRAAGISEVVVARLGPEDVPEDMAARRLAEALVPDPEANGLRLGRAATGRVNLHATGAGVVQVDAARIDAANAVHPMITIATVRPWQRLAPRGMAATIKIISYAVPAGALDRACAAAAGGLRLHGPQCRSAQLIETAIGGAEMPDTGRRAIRARLDRLGVALSESCTVPHEEQALAGALARSKADAILILTASATSDPEDTAPAALRAAGGSVTHFGMPVDPGNLLFFGTLAGRPVIGLPGCARSPALNGADWVLERLLCGIDVSSRDIMAMGVGGLLKEPPSRPSPREG